MAGATHMADLPVAPVEPVLHGARAAVAALPRGAAAAIRIAVALSGGRDSMVLLDALATLAPDMGFALSALHVHHGLSINADAWAEFCADQCAKRGVPLAVHRADIRRAAGESLEARARAARYAAYAAADADVVALAHHADDQAETLLLQLLRGAGPEGLAAMPAHRPLRKGLALLRPFLALPRVAIDAYAAARGLAWVDDESNANTGVKRNFIRHDVAPRLAAAFPGYPVTLVRAAAHQAEAARLIDELAALDAQGAVADDPVAGATLDRTALIVLAARAPHRARNLLRWFLRQHQLAAPSAARLAAMLDQLSGAAPHARVRLVHAGVEVGFHRGRIVVHAPAVAPFAVTWRGEARLALPHGTLEFASCTGTGVARAVARFRQRHRSDPRRRRAHPARLRSSMPGIERSSCRTPECRRGNVESLPLVFCGEALAVVPGIGVDVAFQAAAGTPGYEIRWRPAAP